MPDAMESLLMGGDDSSSGDSDNEDNNIQSANNTASAVAATVQPKTQPAPNPAPAPAPAPATTPTASAPPSNKGGGGNSQSDQLARLKSLYSSQPRKQTATPTATSASASSSTPTSTPTASNNNVSTTTPQPASTATAATTPPPNQSNNMTRQTSNTRSVAPPSNTTATTTNNNNFQPQQQQPPHLSAQTSQSPSPHPMARSHSSSHHQHQHHQSQRSTSTSYQQPSSTSALAAPHGHPSHQTVPPRSSSHHRTTSHSMISPPATTQQAAADPFAPTPLNQIKDRRPSSAMGSSSSQRSHYPPPSSSSATTNNPLSVPNPTAPNPSPMSSSSTSRPTDRAAMERELRRQKEKFLMFTRILMKYLEQKDPALHQKAKATIKDCAERNKRQERGYESVTASMKTRLKEVVGEQYWRRAEQYLKTVFEQKAKAEAAKRGMTHPSSSSTTTPPGSSSSTPPRPSSSSSSTAQMEREKARKLQAATARPSSQQAAPTANSSSASLSSAKSPLPHSGSGSDAAPAAAIANLRQEIATKRQAIQSKGGVTTSPMASSSTTTTTKSKSGSTTKKQSTKRGSKSGGRKSSISSSASQQPTTPSADKSQSSTSQTPTSGTATAAPTTGASKTAKTTSTKAAADSATPAAATEAATATTTPAAPEAPVEPPPREYDELMEMVDHAATYDWTTAGLILGSKSQTNLNEEQKKLLYSNELKPKVIDIPPTVPPPSAEAEAGGTITTSGEGVVKNSQLKGWGKRNVLSARAAWARIRLREQSNNAKSRAPTVGGGLLTLPGSAASNSDSTTSSTAWVNEETAEKDMTLAILSEGCEIYLKGILEKAIHCARQRQNLDGIRLWHQQHVPREKGVEPPLAVRLGCDVSRQVSQAAGNAAMICKRMEEALECQSHVPSRYRTLNDETLRNVNDMGELSLLPRLAKGVESADTQGKRSFEVYGGKEARDPPLGRVPKKAKLEAIDLMMGMNFTDPGRHRAGSASASVFY